MDGFTCKVGTESTKQLMVTVGPIVKRGSFSFVFVVFLFGFLYVLIFFCNEHIPLGQVKIILKLGAWNVNLSL